MKNCTTGLLIACLCLLSSCRNRDTIRPGNYQISGITKTPLADFKIIYDCVLPVFEFRKGGTLCVFPDFNFGYFKDSLFTYKLKGGYLHLNGQHIKHKILCEPYAIGNEHCYELFLDSELIIKIFITKND